MPNPSPTPRQHFNSRPSARGDDAGTGGGLLLQISIHAPPRGATLSRVDGRRSAGNFNSRPSARGDRAFVQLLKLVDISIHAPPRGATLRRLPDAPESAYFNSRPSARGDHNCPTQRAMDMDFNSRPSARGDSKRYAISANLLFNPYKSAWLNNNATQFVEIILVIFHRIIA